MQIKTHKKTTHHDQWRKTEIKTLKTKHLLKEKLKKQKKAEHPLKARVYNTYL